MVKTLDELRKATSDELYTYYTEAQGNTKDFQNAFGTDYSYSTLIAEMKARGYVNGMYIPADKKDAEKDVYKITIRQQNGNGCMNLTMTNECKEKYKAFVAENGNAYAHTTAALTLYMELFKAGRLDVSMSLTPAKKGKKRAQSDNN